MASAPHRGAHDAIAKVVDLYNQGYRRIVDLNLKAYFDNVNHDLMIKYLQQYTDDPWTLRLKQRVKKALKLLTKRNRGISLTRMFEEIQRKMRGWLQYYSIGKLTDFIQRLDKWLRARIRQYIWKQWKKFKTKVTNLQKLGLAQRDAYVFASSPCGY